MNLSELSIKRPVFAVVCSIVIIIFGAIGFSFLGVREYPAIDPPVVNVRASYVGANAEIIEQQITEPLEKAVNGVEESKILRLQVHREVQISMLNLSWVLILKEQLMMFVKKYHR